MTAFNETNVRLTYKEAVARAKELAPVFRERGLCDKNH